MISCITLPIAASTLTGTQKLSRGQSGQLLARHVITDQDRLVESLDLPTVPLAFTAGHCHVVDRGPPQGSTSDRDSEGHKEELIVLSGRLADLLSAAAVGEVVHRLARMMAPDRYGEGGP